MYKGPFYDHLALLLLVIVVLLVVKQLKMISRPRGNAVYSVLSSFICSFSSNNAHLGSTVDHLDVCKKGKNRPFSELLHILTLLLTVKLVNSISYIRTCILLNRLV